MDHSGRQRRLQAALAESNLDTLLVTHPPNIRYLCGFTGSAGVLLTADRGTTFFTDGRYRTQARAEVVGPRIVIARKSPLLAAAEFLAASRIRSVTRLGLESQSVTLGQHEQLRRILKGKWKLVSAPPLVERARMIKDKEEIRRIRASVQLGASLFQIARKTIRPGVKEVDVAAAMEYEARRAGAEGMSFSTIIAAGKRSAVVHGRAAEALDEAARKVLRKSNLAQYFTHSTGHGLGLEIHEAPRLAVGQKQVLEPGMVITIEPGAYIPGKHGVRIEDVV